MARFNYNKMFIISVLKRKGLLNSVLKINMLITNAG